MDDNFDTTIQTYKDNFSKYVERTVSEPSGEFKEWMDLFLSKLPEKGTVLELGSASGRDARYFSSKGFKVVCTDIIPEALENLSKEGFETHQFDFRDNPRPEWNAKFDGFFANAVLLHATPDVFEKSLHNAIKVLKPDGVIAFSLKTGQGDKISYEKLDAPRYFKYYSKEELQAVINKLPVDVLEFSKVDEGKWFHVILKLK